MSSTSRVSRLKNEIADVAATDGQSVESKRFLAFKSHLHLLEVSVHRDIDAGHRAGDHRPIHQLHRHCLVGQLHQEAHELHSGGAGAGAGGAAARCGTLALSNLCERVYSAHAARIADQAVSEQVAGAQPVA